MAIEQFEDVLVDPGRASRNPQSSSNETIPLDQSILIAKLLLEEGDPRFVIQDVT